MISFAVLSELGGILALKEEQRTTLNALLSEKHVVALLPMLFDKKKLRRILRCLVASQPAGTTRKL